MGGSRLRDWLARAEGAGRGANDGMLLDTLFVLLSHF